MIRQPREEGCQSWTLPTLQGPLASTTCPLPSPQGTSGPLPLPLPGENYSFPLLDKHHHILYFPPLLLESTERVCGPCLWTPPPGARGQAGTRPRKSGFHPSHRAAHLRLNPTPRGATNLPPSTVQPNLTLSGCPEAVSGAAQPVGQALRRTAASPHPASFTDGLTYAHTHRPGTLPQHPRQLDSSPTCSVYKAEVHSRPLGSEPDSCPTSGTLSGVPWGVVGCLWSCVDTQGLPLPPHPSGPFFLREARLTFYPAERRLRPRVPTRWQGDSTELLAQALGRAAEGSGEQGVPTGRWARGSHSITPTPSQAQGCLSPLTPRRGPGATLGPLPGAAQMAPCPPALHLHEPQLSPSAAPAASGRRSITGPPLPSVRVSSLWGAEWLSQWL